MNGMYVVVELNQASHQPRDVVVFADSETEALEIAADLRAENLRSGRRESFRVFVLEPVEEDEN
jgi:hypothetical protein